MRGQKVQKNISGFTLIEIVVTFFIMTFIVWCIVAIFNMADKVWNSDMGIVDLQQDARQAMDRMINEIRQARNFTGCNVTTSGTTGDMEISFCVPVDITTFPVTPSQSIRYYRDTSIPNLPRIIRDHAGTTSVVGVNIDSLNFLPSPFSGDIVEIELTATKTTRGRTLCFPSPCVNPKRTLLEKVRLRNE